MVKLLDILFRTLLGSGTTWNQAERKVFKDLGINKTDWINWKPHIIIEIDSEKNIVILKSESGNIFQIESDKKTIRNLIKGISENQFLPKYGSDFINEIRGWTYSYSRTKPAEYKIDLRAKLKPEDQTTEKRKKMYHKRNINVTKFFIKKLVEKTK
ncbi:hypothetical protein JJL45_11525 [Tamlana sp. s12]|uniref:hypothetical protein n=1 Tax=Tamlana sp. s12 TaxID=1630406 RepID=UPI000801846B|nr:hypothetical protein [Tamlana sp. s12]OBQ51763.1 hypothetical protein VQ01_14900 [Tamlana sp. s12]QQY81553.1 hypothetical protein JJL45_11525 [Tamlana sp. s12]